jgi:hypothetical protein
MVIEFKRPPRLDTPGAVPAEFVVVMRNENRIMAVIGPDGQADLAGFGDTAADALRDLADKMDAEKYPWPGIDFER